MKYMAGVDFHPHISMTDIVYCANPEFALEG